jgi:hypothetical protein
MHNATGTGARSPPGCGYTGKPAGFGKQCWRMLILKGT